MVWHYNFGLTGIAWATVGNCIFNLVTVFLYIYFSKHEGLKKTWTWLPPRNVFVGICKTFAFYINGGLMIIFSWCSLEIIGLMAGQLDTNSITINVVLINCALTMYLIPYSISIVGSNLIG